MIAQRLYPLSIGGEKRVTATVETEVAQGNARELTRLDTGEEVERRMVDGVLYTRVRSPLRTTGEEWTVETRPLRRDLAGLDTVLLILGMPGVQVESLGPDPLPEVRVPTVKYKVTIPGKAMHTYMSGMMQQTLQRLEAGGQTVPANPSDFAQMYGEFFGVDQTAYVWVGQDEYHYRVDLALSIKWPDGQTRLWTDTSTRYYAFNDPSISVTRP